MNIAELEEKLKKENIDFNNRTICKIIGMAEAAYSRKKSDGSDLKAKHVRQIEECYAINLSDNLGIDFVDLDYYPDVFGSCGSGLLVASETKEKITVPKANIKSYSENKKYSVITAKGESMAPDIKSDDKLIIEHTETIQDNKVYIFSYQENIYVKRLVKNISELVVISDNPDKEIYATQKITDFSSLRVIGQVIGLMRDMV